MATTVQETTRRVWACRIFCWTEEGESRGIEASLATDALVIGRYVEMQGLIRLANFPLPAITDLGERIEKERKFLAATALTCRGEREEWMDNYPSARLSRFLEVRFAVKEADIFRDELLFEFGNVNGNTENRTVTFKFFGAGDREGERYVQRPNSWKYHEGLIAFRVLTQGQASNVTGLEVSSVWRVSGAGESITRPEYYFDVGMQYKHGANTYQLFGRSREKDALDPDARNFELVNVAPLDRPGKYVFHHSQTFPDLFVCRLSPTGGRPEGALDLGNGDYLIAFSRVCTHLGCMLLPKVARDAAGNLPSADGLLICPCHQSCFDLTARGLVVIGPATDCLPGVELRAVDQPVTQVKLVRWIRGASTPFGVPYLGTSHIPPES